MNATAITPKGLPKGIYKIIFQFDNFYLFRYREQLGDPVGFLLAKINGDFLEFVRVIEPSDERNVIFANRQVVFLQGFSGIEHFIKIIIWIKEANHTKYLIEHSNNLFIYDASQGSCFVCLHNLRGIKLNGCLNLGASIYLLQQQRKKLIGHVNYDYLHRDFRSIPKRNSNDIYLVFHKEDTEHPCHHFCQGLNEPTGVDSHDLFPDMCGSNLGSTFFVFDPNGNFLGLFNGEEQCFAYDLKNALVCGRFLYLITNYYTLEVVDLAHLEAKEIGGGLHVKSFCDNLIVKKSAKKIDNSVSWQYKSESYLFLGEDKIVESGDVLRVFDYPTPSAETICNAFPKTFHHEAIALKMCLHKLTMAIPNEIFWHIMSFASC